MRTLVFKASRKRAVALAGFLSLAGVVSLGNPHAARAQSPSPSPSPAVSGTPQPNAIPVPGSPLPASSVAPNATLAPDAKPSAEATMASRRREAGDAVATHPPARSRRNGSTQPTPFPQYTLGPASVPTDLAYPAYGSPAPGIGVGPTPAANVAPPVVTLPEAIAIAYARNPSLQAARADVGLAKAAKRLAQTGYLPSIGATFTTQHDNRQGGSSTIGTTGSNGATAGVENFDTGSSSTNNSGSISLSQTIFDGFRIAYEIRAASLNDTAAADTYKRELQTIAYDVATAYYNSLLAQRTTGVAVETVKLDQVQEDLVRAQIRAGTAARADLSTAELPTAQARVALVRDQASELSAQATFANALGLDADLDILPADDTPLSSLGKISTIAAPGYGQSLLRAYALRPDYLSSQHVLESAQASLRAARAAYYPTITGQAQTGTGSTDESGGSFRNSNSVSATISIPIFAQGVTQANVDSARSQIDLDAANLEGEKQAVQLNVKQTLVELISSRQALDEAQAEYVKANDVVRSTQAQYRAGVTTLPLLLNAQVGLTQALTDQVTSVYALRQAEQAYLYAVGSNTP